MTSIKDEIEKICPDLKYGEIIEPVYFELPKVTLIFNKDDKMVKKVLSKEQEDN